jgi:hypothetical protein
VILIVSCADAFLIFQILEFNYGNIRPDVWKAYNLHNVFPNKYMQDMQGFLKIEAYCFASTVYYLNSFTRYRLRRLQKQDHIDDIQERVLENRSPSLFPHP